MGIISLFFCIFVFLYITGISLTSAKYLQKHPPPSVCLCSLGQRPAAFSSSRAFCWQKWIPAFEHGTGVMLGAWAAPGMAPGDKVPPAAVTSPRAELGFAATAPDWDGEERSSPAELGLCHPPMDVTPPEHSWGGQGTK